MRIDMINLHFETKTLGSVGAGEYLGITIPSSRYKNSLAEKNPAPSPSQNRKVRTDILASESDDWRRRPKRTHSP
jgi:hypothetical protein